MSETESSNQIETTAAAPQEDVVVPAQEPAAAQSPEPQSEAQQQPQPEAQQPQPEAQSSPEPWPAAHLIRSQEEFVAFVKACAGGFPKPFKIPAGYMPMRYPVLVAIELPSGHQKVTLPSTWVHEDEWTDEQRAMVAGYLDGSVTYDFAAEMRRISDLATDVRKFHEIRAQTFMKDFAEWRAARGKAQTA